MKSDDGSYDFSGSQDNLVKNDRATLLVLVSCLFILAILYTLALAATILVPILFSILLGMLLIPIVRFLKKLYLPPAVGAGLILLFLIGLMFGTLNLVAEPASRWAENLPTILEQVQQKTRELRDPVVWISDASEQVGEITTMSPEAQASSSSEVILASPSWLDQLMSDGQRLLANFVLLIFLTYFLLSTWDSLLRRASRIFRQADGSRGRIVGIADELQSKLSRYLLVITAINFTLGAVVAGLMHLAGLPNPLLWGLMVALFNFAPYIGAATSFTLITIASILTFDSFAEAALPPLAFLAVTGLEGLLVTPLIVGRQLYLSPLLVFLSVVFWGWLWGVAGALMAVPILVTLKFLLGSFDKTQQWALLMGEIKGQNGRTLREIAEQRKKMTENN